MKLMTLNLWGGHVYDPLMKFLEEHRDVDIFCFQEVYHNATSKITDEERFIALDIFNDIARILPEHEGYFRPAVNGVYGLATFVKKSVSVIEEGDSAIYTNHAYSGVGPAHSRIMQWLRVGDGSNQYFIANVHGLWNGKGKSDTPNRLLQSKNIRNTLDRVEQPVILCGDFNLRPDTESLRYLERGMRNLIKEYQVTSTRTSYYPKPEKFADYVLASPDVKVSSFNKLCDEVSDHSPLLVDFF